jgi:hypothetical protein
MPVIEDDLPILPFPDEPSLRTFYFLEGRDGIGGRLPITSNGRLPGVEGPVATPGAPPGGVQDVVNDLVGPLGGHHCHFDLVEVYLAE